MSQHEELVCCVGCSCETLISPAVERATAVGWGYKCRTNNKPPTYFQDECELGMHEITDITLHYMWQHRATVLAAQGLLNVYCFMNQVYDLTIRITPITGSY